MTAEGWGKKWGSLPQEPQEPIEEKEGEIERLKALLTRAANVLEIINKGWPISELGLDPAIIAELRKAAQ